MRNRTTWRRVGRWAGAGLYAAMVMGVTVAIVVALRAYIYDPNPDILRFVYEGEEIKLLEPRAFYLALVAPVVLALAYANLTDFSWFQRIINIGLRLALLAAMILALARPSVSRYESKMCTVYLVDVSESVPEVVLGPARDLVQRGMDTRGTHLVRLITFAERPLVVPLPATGEVAPILRHEGPRAGLATNPAAALRLSYGLCPRDHLTRAVLITDGNQNRGDLLAEAATAADFGVRLYTHEIEFEPEPEVMVMNLEFPDVVELSAPFNLTAEIYSNRETTARINLTQNEFRDIRGQTVDLQPGINRVDLVAEVYEPGIRRFTLDVLPDGPDRFRENNTFVRTIVVEGRPRVLYVEGEDRSRIYLQRALDRERNDLANFDLEVRGARAFPTTLDEMVNFDLIILSDVHADFISRTAMTNVQRYVREHGGGFLMVGGERSFGPGGYDNTLFEDIAPVTFDMQRQRDTPSLAVMLVIDRSGSMSGARLEMAKEAARAVVDMLAPQDSIGVLTFDHATYHTVRLQPATNRGRIRDDIGRISLGGGTDIFMALTDAYVEMIGYPARIRHAILLTDGEASWSGIADVVNSMRADGITVSSVAIGREADRALLEMIADLGGGRFYATNDPNNIPQIFVQETSQVARTNLVEEPFRAVPVRRSQATAGIAWDSTPYLLGYVQTQAKRGAEVLLQTERGDPLLARWRVGLGRVGVFTSDVKNRWAVEWVRHRMFPQFWAQVVRDMMRVRSDDVLMMRTEISEGRAHIIVDAIDENDRFINGLVSVVEVTGPDRDRRSVDLEQTAAGRYEGSFELDAYGPYMLQAEHTFEGSTVAISTGSLTYPFPDEYLSFEPNRELPRQAAALTGGGVDPEPEALWDPLDELTEVREELWPYALFLALGILMLDLLMRRVRLFGRRPVRWGRVIAG